MSDRLFVHFCFLRLDVKFHTLQSNEKLVARQEFLSSIEPMQRDLPFFAAYSLTGLRADCEVLLWRAAKSLETLQSSFERMRAFGMGKYLEPVTAYLAVHSGTLEPPGKPYLFLHPHEVAAEETRLLAKHPSIKARPFEMLEFAGHASVTAYETDSPSDFLEFRRELRSLKSSAQVSAGDSVYPAIRKDIRDLVDALG